MGVEPDKQGLLVGVEALDEVLSAATNSVSPNVSMRLGQRARCLRSAACRPTPADARRSAA